ncbi:MAG: adenylate/guanylate cyclase domain-containing protein [Desulfobacterales bacterium]|nr:adenylate/guanylate cyclase domain-containing protein [Desulfobacterales bacterium]
MRPFHLSPKQKRNVSKIIPFGIICFGFGIVWAIVERSLLGNLDSYPATGLPYDFGLALFTTSISSLIFGSIVGAVEILFLNRLFVRRPFGIKIVIKTIIYVAALATFLICLTFLYNFLTFKASPFDPILLEKLTQFILSFSFWGIIVYMGTTIGVMLFFSEVSDNLGQGVLRNFLIGRYHKSRVEERIFMFLDMKSSTTIAENLGHVRYYQLLNDYYADITEAIIQTSGQIYQYVGDEVVVSWKLKDGLIDNNCLRCFFTIKDIFRNRSEEYIEEYGLVPGFKAGIHYGKVTTGEIGVVKKEIIFTGDVLNTTARIQSICNVHEVDILISNDLFSRLNTGDEYALKEIGVCELKGKDKKVKLVTIDKK